MLVVGVYVVHKNNKAPRLSWKGLGRNHSVIRINAVHPDDAPLHEDLGMDCSTVLVTLKDSGLEAEGMHQKALSGFEVLVNSQGNDSLMSEVALCLRHLIQVGGRAG